MNTVARPPVGSATVNGMLVVEASACRVELNQLITHDEALGRWLLESIAQVPGREFEIESPTGLVLEIVGWLRTVDTVQIGVKLGLVLVWVRSDRIGGQRVLEANEAEEKV